MGHQNVYLCVCVRVCADADVSVCWHRWCETLSGRVGKYARWNNMAGKISVCCVRRNISHAVSQLKLNPRCRCRRRRRHPFAKHVRTLRTIEWHILVCIRKYLYAVKPANSRARTSCSCCVLSPHRKPSGAHSLYCTLTRACARIRIESCPPCCAENA